MPTNKQYWLNAGPWLLFIAGAITGLCCQLYYYKFIGTDTLSYINAGELYAAGRFREAINGYWSPLYCWLIAFFIKTGLRPHITCYCINIGAAAACFYFMRRLGRRYLSSTVFFLLFQLFIMGTLLFYAMSDLTPDLLGTAACSWLLTLLWSDRFTTPSRLWALAGLAGALAFLAKSYNFLFVNLLFGLVLLWQSRSSAERRNGRYAFTGRAFLAFWAISLLWIIPLSLHEKQPVFSTAGGYSHNYVNPARPGHPVTKAIIPPPFEGAYTAWLNPAHQLDSFAWSPFDSREKALYQLQLVAHNAQAWYGILDYHHLKTVLLLVCIGVLVWYDKTRLRQVLLRLRPLLLVLLLYPLGYLPYFVLERYLYLEVLIFFLLLFYLVQEAFAVLPPAGQRAGRVALLWMGAAAAYWAIPSSGFTGRKMSDYLQYRSLHLQQPRLQFLAGKNIVCDQGDYVIATQLCYRLEARLYGVWSPEQQDKVQQYHIEYLITNKPRREDFWQLREQLPLERGVLYVYRFVPGSSNNGLPAISLLQSPAMPLAF